MNRGKSPYVLGIDFGTSSVRVAIFDLKGNSIIFREEEYPLYTPRLGWAEQKPQEWWGALCKASQRSICDSGINPKDITGISADATSCTVLLVDKSIEPVYPAIMWMDVRSSAQTKRITETKHPALKYNGFGNASAEWMPCKALWLKENEPEKYNKAVHVLECIDWLMYKLTGRLTASINNTSARWYYDRPSGGWPYDFYSKIGLEDLIKKFPQDIIDMGEKIGTLLDEPAKELGLVPGIPVGEGGADAYVGMIGLNVVEPGRMALITGSSHLHLALSDKEIHAPGIFGSYPDAIVRGTYMIEGGQISTGSIVNWYKNNFCSYLEKSANERGVSVYRILDEEAEKLPIGSEGLIVLDYFQGNRTPYTDQNSRGLIYGLTLKHTPINIFRAIIEGICYGTEHILKTFEKAGLRPDKMYLCGGAAKSRWWLQAHADVSNIPIYIPKISEAPSLGAAILGAVAGGAYSNIQEASKNMVSFIDKIEPNFDRYQEYSFYTNKYIELYPKINGWMDDITSHSAKNNN